MSFMMMTLSTKYSVIYCSCNKQTFYDQKSWQIGKIYLHAYILNCIHNFWFNRKLFFNQGRKLSHQFFLRNQISMNNFRFSIPSIAYFICYLENNSEGKFLLKLEILVYFSRSVARSKFVKDQKIGHFIQLYMYLLFTKFWIWQRCIEN